MAEYMTVGWLINRLQKERHPDDPVAKFTADSVGWTFEVPFGIPGGPLAVGDPVTVNKGSITEYDAVVVPQSEKIPPGEVNVMEVGSGSVATRRLAQLTRRDVVWGLDNDDPRGTPNCRCHKFYGDHPYNAKLCSTWGSADDRTS